MLTRTELTDSETETEESEAMSPEDDLIGEPKKLFKTLLVKKFIFESTKNELETINLLIDHFDKQKSILR